MTDKEKLTIAIDALEKMRKPKSGGMQLPDILTLRDCRDFAEEALSKIQIASGNLDIIEFISAISKLGYIGSPESSSCVFEVSFRNLLKTKDFKNKDSVGNFYKLEKLMYSKKSFKVTIEPT